MFLLNKIKALINKIKELIYSKSARKYDSVESVSSDGSLDVVDALTESDRRKIAELRLQRLNQNMKKSQPVNIKPKSQKSDDIDQYIKDWQS